MYEHCFNVFLPLIHHHHVGKTGQGNNRASCAHSPRVAEEAREQGLRGLQAQWCTSPRPWLSTLN